MSLSFSILEGKFWRSVKGRDKLLTRLTHSFVAVFILPLGSAFVKLIMLGFDMLQEFISIGLLTWGEEPLKNIVGEQGCSLTQVVLPVEAFQRKVFS